MVYGGFVALFQARLHSMLVPDMKALLTLLFTSMALCGEPVTNSIGMTLMPISAGSFTMGQEWPPSDYHIAKHPEKYDDADWDERPSHCVTITRPFHMGATEVTLEQYRAMDASFRAGEKEGDEAVCGISWEQAVKFCFFAGFSGLWRGLNRVFRSGRGCVCGSWRMNGILLRRI